jgi:hypothetical protein
VASVCANYDSLIRHPGMTQIVMWFHLLEVKEWLQSSFMVSEVFEYSIPNNTELCVILRIEAYLKKSYCEYQLYNSLRNFIGENTTDLLNWYYWYTHETLHDIGI